VSDELGRRIAAELPCWRLDGEELVASWSFADFAGALAAAVAVGMIAERANHHPDLVVGWGRLVVRLTTHDAGGITSLDVDLAQAIQDRLGAPSR